MKRKPLLFLAGLAALLAAALLIRPHIGTRPFRDLTAGDIQSVKLELFPPNVEFTLTPEEIGELVPLLNGVVVYRRDDSYWEYNGQACIFTLTLTDGSQTVVSPYNPFLIVDSEGWRTKSEPCAALSRFANTLRN